MGTFLPQEAIRNKRDGQQLSRQEIQSFIDGVTEGSVSDAQIAAFAMAVFFNGMDASEQAAMTGAMTRSGSVIDWSDMGLNRPVVDKHSTGGVGDKVSLMLAPIVAACGAHVPMISGRGLGHTGGTLDKLESIPGYDAFPNEDRFKQITKEVGCSIIGQTGDLAPADKRIYAVRDTTATVESIPMITASILSKKLAAGLDALVMDVKVGKGAFMDSFDKAKALASNIVRVAGEAGTPTTAVLTDMNSVLGSTVGNALEVREAIEFLTGDDRDARLETCTIELAAHMLSLSGAVQNVDAARSAAQAALNDGRATEVFQRMVVAQGGPADLVENHDTHLVKAPVMMDIFAPCDGVVTGMDSRAIGVAVIGLGGGRTRVEDAIDHAVGFDHFIQTGTKVDRHSRVARVHAADQASADAAAKALCDALVIDDRAAATVDPIILEVLEANG